MRTSQANASKATIPAVLRRFALIGSALFVVLVVLLSCVGEPTAPKQETPRFATGVRFNAIFPEMSKLSGVADLIAFDRVRVVLRRADGTVAIDTTINFPANVDAVTISLDIRLSVGAPATGEPLQLDLAYKNAGGETVFSGSAQIIAVPTVPGQAAPAPVSIPVVYTGAGANAKSVRISPRSLSVNTGAPFAFTAQAFDAAGNVVPSTPILWTTLDPTRATLPLSTAGTGTALTVRGQARIVAQLITLQADTVTLDVRPIPTALAAVSGSGQTAVVGKPTVATLAQPLVVKVTAADGLGVPGIPVTFSVATGGGSITSASSVTDANGGAQASWKLGNTPGIQTVTASAGSLPSVSFSATAVATVATKLVVTAGPTAGSVLSAGSPISVVVAARDVADDLVTGYNGSVSLALSSIVPTATIVGTTTANAVNGVATFSNLKINAPGIGYVITASASGLTPAPTAAFSIVTGPAASMVLLTGGGQTAAAGTALAPITVVLTDAAGNAKTGDSVTFSVTAGGGSVTPGGVRADASGRATTIWTLGPLGGTQTLSAAAIGVQSLSVNATATNTTNVWVITQQPAASHRAGATVTPPLLAEFRTPAGALVTTFTGTATLALGANPGSATLGGTASVAAVAGVATFASYTLNKVGTGYTLTVSSSGATSATSSAFDVTAASAATLALVSGNGQTGAFSTALAQPIVANVQDAFGNPVAGVTVTFAVTSGAGTLGTPTATTSASGIASTTWTLGASGAQALSVTSSGLSGSPLAVTANLGAGALASTTVSPQVDTITSITGTRPLTVTGRDAAGNVVAGNWTWLSRNTSAATVNTSGLVTAVANGAAYIVATDAGGTKDSSRIVVQQRIATINVNPAAKSLYVTGNFTYTATAVDGSGVAMTTQPTLAWSSTAPAVATVNATTGAVNAVSIGSAQIRATSGSTVGVSNLTVLTPITRIDVSFDSLNAPAPDVFTMPSLGNRRMYRAVARDTLLNVMSGITFTWASTNASVALIDSTTTTKARALSAANGITSIQASAQGITGGATLNVSQVLASIDLSPPTAIVAVTGTISMLARGKDANARFISGGSFAYASSAPAFATINSSTGVVTGVAIGTTNITATSGSITSNAAVVSVNSSGPAIISFGRDTLGIGRGSSLSVPIYLSKPNGAAVTVNLAVADTFAFWSVASVTVPAGQTAVNATLNGRNAGTTFIMALDGSRTLYAGDTAVLAVQANLRMASGGYSLNATDQVATQVLLSDPSPAGGTYVTFSYGTAGRASASPDPAFIPAGQLASNVVITGLAAGSTSITPSATGVTGNAASINVSSPVLSLSYSSIRLGSGQFEPNVYVQVPNTLNTPLSVTLTSADTSVAAVPPSVTIGAGISYAYFNVAAKARGTTFVIATAPGWTPDTFTVISTTPFVRVTGGTTLNVTSPTQNATVYAADSLRTIHSRSSSLAVRFSSSDPLVLRVIDTLVTIGAGANSTFGRVTPGGAGGTAWLYATASGHAPDSTLYTLVGPRLTLSYTTNRVGVGLYEPNHYVLIPNAIGSPLTVTLSNSDPTKAGTPTTVTIPQGTTYAYFTLSGLAAGTSTVIVSAPGYGSDTGVTVVNTPRIQPLGSYTLNAYSTASVYAYTADSAGSYQAAIAPIAVRLVSSDTLVLKVDSVLTVPAGSYNTSTTALVTAVGPGTAKIYVSAPGMRPDTSSWAVQPAKLTLSWTSYVIGNRQHRLATDFSVSTPGNRAVTVPVTLTQKRPAIVSLSATTVTILANQNYQYFGFGGLALGRDTIIASAPGYLPDTGFVTVSTPKLRVFGLPGSAVTTSPPASMTLYTADSTNNIHYASGTVVVRAVSTDSTVIKPGQPFFSVAKDTYYANPTVVYVGPGTARMIYSDSAGSGYQPDSTNTVTVTGPSLVINGGAGMLGVRQVTSPNQYYVYTVNNVTAPLTVNLVSTDPRVATVPASITIPTGQNYQYFDISAQDTIGTIQIQATATGFSLGTVNMQVTVPKFVISASSSVYTTSGPQGITVYAVDQNGTTHYVSQAVTVTLASSATGVASLDSTTVTIPAGQYLHNTSRWLPGVVGTATLSASDPRAQTQTVKYPYTSGVLNVNVITPSLNVYYPNLSLGLGQYADQYVYLPNTATAPLTVSIGHAAQPRTNTPASVVIPVGTSTSPAFRITATSAGSDTLTLSATGHANGKSVIVAGLGRVDPLSGWLTQIKAGDSTQVTLYTRDVNFGTNNVAVATTFVLAPNANVQFVTGGATSTVITSITVPADANYVQFYLKGVSAGPGSATITNLNYSQYSNTVTVTP